MVGVDGIWPRTREVRWCGVEREGDREVEEMMFGFLCGIAVLLKEKVAS